MKNLKTINFGEHITIDGYGGDRKKLNDKNLVIKCLDELPAFLDMHKLSKPLVYFAPCNDKADPGGWSGVIIINESHISIHTFPARKFVSIDVYTCKNGLDRSFIKKYFRDIFKLKDIEENFLKRGTRYPACDVC